MPQSTVVTEIQASNENETRSKFAFFLIHERSIVIFISKVSVKVLVKILHECLFVIFFRIYSVRQLIKNSGSFFYSKERTVRYFL